MLEYREESWRNEDTRYNSDELVWKTQKKWRNNNNNNNNNDWELANIADYVKASVHIY